MRVHFSGEPDDGLSVSSQHARALRRVGVDVTFDDPEVSWRHVCRHADVIHLVSTYSRDFGLLRRIRLARSSGVVVFRYWTGLDVLWARCHEPTRRVASALERLDVVQLAPHERLRASLGRIGIRAVVQPPVDPIVSADTEPQALPDTFTVLTHLPTDARDLRGGPTVDRLIRRFPGIRFLILGDRGSDYSAHASVESLGRVDDAYRVIHRSTVILDARVFEGTSRLVIEGLSLGRHAVTTAPFPHALHATAPEEMERAIMGLRHDPRFNLPGREFVGCAYDHRAQVQSLMQAFEAALAPGTAALKLRGGIHAGAIALRMPSLFSRKTFALPDPATLDAFGPAVRLMVQRARARHACAATPVG